MRVGFGWRAGGRCHVYCTRDGAPGEIEELARASAIGERMLSDPYVRVREPTDEVRAHRDAKWEERRQERRRDYEQRMAKIAAQREARRLAQERRKEERKLKGAASAGQLPLMPL